MIDKIKSYNSNIEYISINNGIVKTIKEKEAFENKKDNIYYLGGVRKDLVYNNGNRAKDIDIFEKNYICIDIDLRKNFENKYGEEITDEDIIKEGINIGKYLKDEDKYLGDIDYIVFSGNGLHIYYFGEYQDISPDDYSFGVNRIYKQWDKFWGDEVWYSDKACKNIGRILRLPGSINQKTGKECKIIYESQGQGKLFNSLKGLAKKEKIEEKEKREKEILNRVKEYEKKDRMNFLISGKEYQNSKQKTQDLFNKIDSIPAYIIAEIINPQYKLSKNGKNFDNGKGGYTGYYYVEELNAICNGGSRHFLYDGDESSCWSNSNLIKNQYSYTWKETIDYFKQNFKIN